MPIKTRKIERFQDITGNIYESIAIMAKRARQIAAREKMELDEKLKYFEGFDDEDDFSFNEEQERISKEFEKRPHATQRALEEMEKGETYYRRAEDVNN
ncbi:MAG TPA: DNA-directed RNA polymerase subunit omega [Balneolales bacterium]|nr:DNA-directed RNA polymerase subunit omega [Balneolales bacterium]